MAKRNRQLLVSSLGGPQLLTTALRSHPTDPEVLGPRGEIGAVVLRYSGQEVFRNTGGANSRNAGRLSPKSGRPSNSLRFGGTLAVVFRIRPGSTMFRISHRNRPTSAKFGLGLATFLLGQVSGDFGPNWGNPGRTWLNLAQRRTNLGRCRLMPGRTPTLSRFAPNLCDAACFVRRLASDAAILCRPPLRHMAGPLCSSPSGCHATPMGPCFIQICARSGQSETTRHLRAPLWLVQVPIGMAQGDGPGCGPGRAGTIESIVSGAAVRRPRSAGPKTIAAPRTSQGFRRAPCCLPGGPPEMFFLIGFGKDPTRVS